MSLNVLLVRHGDPDYDLDTLTEKGWKQADSLAIYLSQIPVTAFYCSSSGRAKDTAAATLRMTKRDAVYYDWMREFGARPVFPDSNYRPQLWTMTAAEMFSDPVHLDANRWHTSSLLQTANVTTRFDQVRTGLDALLGQHGYQRTLYGYQTATLEKQTLVLFCHLGVSLLMTAYLLNASPFVFWNAFTIAPTGIVRLYTEESVPGKAHFRCAALGDLTHLTGFAD